MKKYHVVSLDGFGVGQAYDREEDAIPTVPAGGGVVRVVTGDDGAVLSREVVYASMDQCSACSALAETFYSRGERLCASCIPTQTVAERGAW